MISTGEKIHNKYETAEEIDKLAVYFLWLVTHFMFNQLADAQIDNFSIRIAFLDFCEFIYFCSVDGVCS